MAKGICPIARPRFLKQAIGTQLVLNGNALGSKPMEFSTGSFGLNISGKVTVMVDGVPVPCQLSGNLVVIDSKDPTQAKAKQ